MCDYRVFVLPEGWSQCAELPVLLAVREGLLWGSEAKAGPCARLGRACVTLEDVSSSSVAPQEQFGDLNAGILCCFGSPGHTGGLRRLVGNACLVVRCLVRTGAA